MKNTAPHYLLITEAKTIIDSREDDPGMSRRSGHWRFVLEQMGVEARIEVADDEPDVFGERLDVASIMRCSFTRLSAAFGISVSSLRTRWLHRRGPRSVFRASLRHIPSLRTHSFAQFVART